ncbi:hypothetical protein MKX01_034952 [Papaver californicum]|nr:hypothetical protein MKX01_034952 [Papaver californicum]
MEENQEGEGVVKAVQQDKQEVKEIEQPVKCTILYKPGGGRTGNTKVYELSGKGQWRQEQRLRASRMEHLPGIHCSQFENLIEEQISKFDGHYSRALGQHQILMPTKCRLPVELACLSWYGNWRPSSILSLVHSFSRTPKISSASGIIGSTPLSRSERVLSGCTAIVMPHQPNWRESQFASPILGRRKHQKKEDPNKFGEDYYLRCRFCGQGIVERERAFLVDHLNVYRVNELGGITVRLGEGRLDLDGRRGPSVSYILLCSNCGLGLGYVPFTIFSQQFGPYYLFRLRVI